MLDEVLYLPQDVPSDRYIFRSGKTYKLTGCETDGK